jgi:hypothetical protein
MGKRSTDEDDEVAAANGDDGAPVKKENGPIRMWRGGVRVQCASPGVRWRSSRWMMSNQRDGSTRWSTDA